MSCIKKIRIKNFKSLEDVEIEMNQLTFLFGPNSSGKSSFIKAMMFLEKNLNPINVGETIYKLSDDVDLLSFSEIVTNNDIKKIVSFELEIEDEYLFPKSDTLFPDNYADNKYYHILKGIDNENVNEYGIQYFDIFRAIIMEARKSKPVTLEDLDDETWNSRTDNDYNNLFENNSFHLKVKIDFCYHEKGQNLHSFFIKDIITGSVYESEVNKFEPEFNLFDNEALTEKFYILFYGTSMGYDWMDLMPYNNKNYILSFTGIDEWDILNEKEKMDYYHKALKLVYQFFRLLPYKLKYAFSNFHLPTVRKIPKSRYLLENKRFENKEYYNFLNELFESQKSIQQILQNAFQKFKEENVNVKTNVLSKSIYTLVKYASEYLNIKFDKKKLTNLKNSEQVIKYISNYLFLDKEEKNILINTNNSLIKFGFDLCLFIKCSEEVGKATLYGSNKSLNMSNASSGLIQILPVFICCSNVQYYSRYSFEKHDNRIGANGFITFDTNEKQEHGTEYYRFLLIEQPELHLHPKLQSQLAELFVETINTANELNTLIIETHSEHLIRKIQVLIARGELDRSKLSVQYFNNENGITKTETMEIDEHGLFVKDWPNGFFDDSVNLTMELFEAIREIKKRNN